MNSWGARGCGGHHRFSRRHGHTPAGSRDIGTNDYPTACSTPTMRLRYKERRECEISERVDDHRAALGR